VEDGEIDDLQIVLQDRDGVWRNWLAGAIRCLDATVVGVKAEEEEEATEPEEKKERPTGSHRVTAYGGLTVYRQPRWNAPVTGTAQFNATVKVTGFLSNKDGNWAAITFEGNTGFPDSTGYVRDTGGLKYSPPLVPDVHLPAGGGANGSEPAFYKIVNADDGIKSPHYENSGPPVYLWSGHVVRILYFLEPGPARDAVGVADLYGGRYFTIPTEMLQKLPDFAPRQYRVTPQNGTLATRPGCYLPDPSIPKDTVLTVVAVSDAFGVVALFDGTYGMVPLADLEPIQTETETSGSDGSDATPEGILLHAVIARRNWDGTGKDDVLDCGSFELISIQMSGPLSTVTLAGTAIPVYAALRQVKRSKVWENAKLSTIAGDIAANNNLKLMFLPASDPLYPRMEQFETPDLAFLSELCRNAGIAIKITNGLLVFYDQAEFEAKPSVLTITPDSPFLSYVLDMGAGQQYASCRVSCTKPDGSVVEGVEYAAGFDESDEAELAKLSENSDLAAQMILRLEIVSEVNSPEEARALAQKQLRLYNKYAKTAQFSFVGNPALVAGVTIMLSGWGAWDGKYIISRAVHMVSGSSGYVTNISLRACLNGL